MKKFIYIISFISIIYSCKQVDSEKDVLFFNREDFKKKTSLSAEIIDFDIPKHPVNYTIIRDSLIIVTNWDGKPYYIEVYNLNTKKNITNIARKGKGPNELLSCDLIYRTNSDHFYLRDFVKQRIAVYSIDSVLERGELYAPEQTELPRYTKDAIYMDSSNIIAYNTYYFESEKIKNNIKPFILIKNKEKPAYDIEKDSTKFFTANVSGGYILASPQNGQILLFHHYKDRIDFYDKNLNRIKSMIGPDHLEPEYLLRDGNSVGFNHKYYRAYYPFYYTDKAIYIIYPGVNGIPSDINYRKPVEIFKISWSGELLEIYKLDRFVYTISIDKDEKYIYGSSLNSPDEYPKLVRYNIDN